MTLGIWTSFDHLEESLNMEELVEIVKAIWNKEHRYVKAMAALKGIDLDKGREPEQEDPVEAAKRRVAARQANMSEDAYEAKESEKRLQSIGFKVVKK